MAIHTNELRCQIQMVVATKNSEVVAYLFTEN
jgi:hypothetical protein